MIGGFRRIQQQALCSRKKWLNSHLPRWVLCLQFLLQPFAFAQQNQIPSPTPPTFLQLADQKIDQAMDRLDQDPDEQTFLKHWNDFAKDMQSFPWMGGKAYDFDYYLLMNQKVVLVDSEIPTTISLSQVRVEPLSLAITKIRAYYDSKSQNLVLEGSRGENDRGEHSKIIARQLIPIPDIVSVIQDNEMIVLLDKHKKVHLISMIFASEQIFKSPIPVLRNVYVPLNMENISPTSFMYFSSPSAPPVASKELTMESIQPLDSEGRSLFRSGDLVLRWKAEDSVREHVDILHRKVFYRYLEVHLPLASQLIDMLSPRADLIEKNILTLDKMDHARHQFMLQLTASTDLTQSQQLLRNVYENFEPKASATLLSSAQFHHEQSRKQFNVMNEVQWNEFYQEAQRASQGNSYEIERRWSELLKQQQEITLQEKKTQQTKKIIIYTAAATAGISYLAFPLLYDQMLADKGFATLNWMIANLYPDVLKDKEYRLPLIGSILSLTALWPLGTATSIFIGQSLERSSQVLKNSRTAFAQQIRDLAKTWSPLSPWQRTNTFGTRIWSFFNYSPWRLFFELYLQQKDFLVALDQGMNPFQFVSANSPLGKAAGIDKSQFLGLYNPFLEKNRMQKVREDKSRIQSTLRQQRNNEKSIAWMIALLVVAENEQVDPATLLMSAKEGQLGHLSSDMLSEIIKNPTKRKEWESLRDLILKEIRQNETKDLSQASISKEELLSYYESTRKLAKELRSRSAFQKDLIWLRSQFKEYAIRARTQTIFYGKSNSDFLSKVIVTPEISNQVRKEFVLDHLMMVIIFALWGARANLAEPTHLTATANGFAWTTPAHWNDLFMNTFGHYFVAASSMALTYLQLKPKAENNYLPTESVLSDQKEFVEPFFQGLVRWTKDVSNPLTADLGGIEARTLKRRLTGVWAGLYLGTAVRMSVLNMSFEHALMAFFIYYIASQPAFGWLWTVVQRGNLLGDEVFAKNQQELKDLYLKASDLKNGRPSSQDFQQLKDTLLKIYQQHRPEVANEILAAQNAQELMLILQEKPALYTREHKFTNWTTTLAIGAGISTFISIPFYIVTTSPDILSQPQTLLSYMALSAAYFTGAYLTLGRKSWEYYLGQLKDQAYRIYDPMWALHASSALANPKAFLSSTIPAFLASGLSEIPSNQLLQISLEKLRSFRTYMMPPPLKCQFLFMDIAQNHLNSGK